MTKELTPCPFCGSSDDTKSKTRGLSEEVFMFCRVCRARGPVSRDPEKAWNNRPLESALEARVAELGAEFQESLQSWAEENEESTHRLNMARALQARVMELEEEASKKDCDSCYRLFSLAEENKMLRSQLARARDAALQWVTYTGGPETLPDMDRLVLVHDGVCYLSAMHRGLVWDYDDRAAVQVKPGDRWTYLPEPPAEVE